MLKHSKGQWVWFIKTVITALFLSLFFCFIQSAYAVCDIKTNGRNFACLDNSRFFWMGDTSWTFSTSDLPCGTSCSSGDFAGYVDVRAAQGFNVIQGNIFHYPKAAEPGRNADEDVKATNENNNSPFCTKSGSQCTSNCTNVAVNSWSYDCPNPAYYQNVKNRIAYMNSQGIIAAIAPGWGANFDCSSIPGVPGAPAWTTAQINSYYDYLAGYFGNANPDLQIIWLVSSNTNSAGPANCSNVTWQSLAARINNVDDNDGQAHLITIHPKASPPGGYDIAQLQNQPCEDPTPVTDNLGGVPVVDGEFNYEVTDSCWDYKTDPNSSCQETNFSGLTSDGACSCDASVNENHHAKPDIVLYGAWSVVMRGGYFTYGNASTYYKFADKSNCIDDKQSTAADDMTILYDFFNNHPDGTVKWNETGFGPKNSPLSSAEDDKLAMGKTGSQYVLYARTAGNFASLNLPSDPGPWTYRSRNIKTGVWTPSLGNPPTTFSGNINSFPSMSADSITLVNKSAVMPLKCSSEVTVAPNGSATILCDLVATGAPENFWGNITFSCSSSEITGESCTGSAFLPQNGTLSGVEITVQTSGSPSPGSYNLQINATATDPNPDVIKSVNSLLNVFGVQCQDFNSIGGLPADWEYKPLPTQASVWSYSSNDAIKGSTFKKGTARPLLGTSTFTSCTVCSIEASVKAEIPIGGTKKFITLYGWWDPNEKKNRVELVLNFEKDKIKLIHKSINKTPVKRSVPFDFIEGTSYLFRVSFDGTQFNVWKDGTQIMSMPTIQGVVPYGIPAFVVKGKKPNLSFSGELDYIDVCYGCIATCSDSCGTSCVFVVAKTADLGEQFSATSAPTSNVAIQNITVVEGSGGINYAQVKIDISEANSGLLSVDYSTSDVTAVSGQDFIAESGTATIETKQSVRVITIPIIADDTIEANETFTINLSNLSEGGSLTQSQAVVTIQDDDTPEEDEEPDTEFEIDCPAQFSVPKDDLKTMSCGVILYDFLDPSTEIAWNCENQSSIACTFQPIGETQLQVDIDPGTATPVGDMSNFTVAGVVETITQSDTLNLHIVNFQHSCPDPITVVKGSYTDSTCSVGQSSNWNDATLQVTWSCSGLPTGASCIFTPNPWNVNSGSSMNLRIQSTTETPTGNYNITVTGTSGQQVRTDSVLLKVVTQTTYTFYPVGDSYLKDNGKNENEGLTTQLRLQHPDRSSHVVLKFSQSNITSTIGTKEIVSANLKLYIETNFNNWGSGASVDVHSMTATWEEYISGSPAQGVTWNCPIDTNLGNANPNCTTQWNGGSYSSTILNTQVHQNNQTGWMTFNITSDLQAIQGGSTHYGWLVRKRNSTDQGSVDYTSIQGSALFKPKLEVTVND